MKQDLTRLETRLDKTRLETNAGKVEGLRGEQPGHNQKESRSCARTHRPPMGCRPPATRLLVAHPDNGGSPARDKAVLAAHLSPLAVRSLDAADPSCLRPSPTAGRAGRPQLSTPSEGDEE